MEQFHWKARTREGQLCQGTLSAATLEEAGKELARQYPYILQLRRDNFLEKQFQGRRSLRDLDRETFFRRLGLLLQGGLPILRALRALEGHSSPAVKELCRELDHALGRGFSLSQALRQQEKQVGKLAGPLAAAGENSGQLPLVFQQLAVFYQKKRENQKAVLQACLYPALVLGLSLVLTGVFCWLVVPLLGDLYQSLRLEPAAGFRLLFTVVRSFQAHPLVFLGLLILQGVGLFLVWRKKSRWLPRLPLIRNWVRTFWEIRFLGLLALLLRGGLPLDRALPQAAQILPEGPCRTCARAMEQAVVAGSSLAGAARQQPLLLSTLAVEFAALGEESGHLPALLTEAAHLLDQDFQNRLKQAKTLLEPVLLLVLAGGCTIMLVLLLSPLFALLQGLPLVP